MTDTPSPDPTREWLGDASVGRNLQRLRAARGLTQGQLAELLARGGVTLSQQTLVKIEHGQRPLRLLEALSIAHALDVEVGALTELPGADHTASFIRQVENVEEVCSAIDALGQELLELQTLLLTWSNDPRRTANLSEAVRDAVEQSLWRRPRPLPDPEGLLNPPTDRDSGDEWATPPTAPFTGDAGGPFGEPR